MKRTWRSFWTMLVLAAGMVAGFGASTLQPQAVESKQPGCWRDSDCDAYCGEPGAGVCHAWLCYCIK